MARLIERAGGIAHVSPSMREVPLDDQQAAVKFAHRVLGGEIDVMIFMTGVGTRLLVGAIEHHVDKAEFLAALGKIATVARGPKPVAALKEFGLTPTYRVPEPNTWRELLETLDQNVLLDGRVVGLQEYGLPNPHLTAGLAARGAKVVPVKIYAWGLPIDVEPLRANIRAICDGGIEVAVFTSQQQIEHLFEEAERMGLGASLRDAMQMIVVASVGPTTSEALREHGLPVDIEPEHPKMGPLVQAAAERANELIHRKRRVSSAVAAAQPNPALTPASVETLPDSLFLRACRRAPTERTPIWLMRQAGRYLPEYRAIREKTSFLGLCKNPDLCAEVMIRTVERIGVDAAIIFSDLLPILEPMGFELEFTQGEGPVIHNPVRDSDQVDRVIELESVDALDFVMETVRRTRAGLRPEIPVIGFAGAPFTLASYGIEGGGSRSFLHTKTLMYRDEGAWRVLMGRLSRAIARYLNAQIAAGAQCVQIFDSWVGCLGPEDYRRYVLPYMTSLMEAIVPNVPVISFATGNPALLPLLAEAGGDVIGIDWRVELVDAWKTVGYNRAVQGNLDPTVLLASPEEIRRRATDLLTKVAGRPGHIFNLGHGVLPQTPVDNVLALIDAVKEFRAEGQ